MESDAGTNSFLVSTFLHVAQGVHGYLLTWQTLSFKNNSTSQVWMFLLMPI
jgi:hypothetical protein